MVTVSSLTDGSFCKIDNAHSISSVDTVAVDIAHSRKEIRKSLAGHLVPNARITSSVHQYENYKTFEGCDGQA